MPGAKKPLAVDAMRLTIKSRFRNFIFFWFRFVLVVVLVVVVVVADADFVSDLYKSYCSTSCCEREQEKKKSKLSK